MNAATERLEFAPPPTRGLLRALVLAVLAHAVLLAVLTSGVQWKSEPVAITAEAELWSELPQQAAPRLVEVPPEPAPPPEPPPPPPPIPEPAPTPPAPPVPEVVKPELPDPAIALEREKLRLKKLELKKQEALEKQKELEKQRLDALKQDKLRLEKKRLEDKRLEDKRLEDKRLQDKQAQLKKAAEDKKKSDQDNQRKEALQAREEAQKLQGMREENLKRMSGLAGANGSPGATGAAQQSAGPSAGYAGRIRARIKPNIVFTEDMTGNPTAEVEVRTSPDGSILSRKLSKSSGVKAWDEAVLKAIDRTESLPRDVDGRVPAALTLVFRPKD